MKGFDTQVTKPFCDISHPFKQATILSRRVSDALFENTGEIIVVFKTDFFGNACQRQRSFGQQILSFRYPDVDEIIDDRASRVFFKAVFAVRRRKIRDFRNSFERDLLHIVLADVFYDFFDQRRLMRVFDISSYLKLDTVENAICKLRVG